VSLLHEEGMGKSEKCYRIVPPPKEFATRDAMLSFGTLCFTLLVWMTIAIFGLILMYY
jgi:hypothetical protein